MPCNWSLSPSPSRVNTWRPASRTASRNHELTGRPSSKTGHVPHAPTPQLSRTLHSLKRSRRTSSSVSASSTISVSARLLIRKVISRFIESNARHFHQAAAGALRSYTSLLALGSLLLISLPLALCSLLLRLHANLLHDSSPPKRAELAPV